MMNIGKIRDALNSGKYVYYYGDTGVDEIDESDEYMVTIIDASGSSVLCEAYIKEDYSSENSFSIANEDLDFTMMDII
jgi:hypothetical protein